MALKYGSKGDDVKQLQEQLNAAGYNLDVDGSYGPKTRAAVKDYQAKNNLQVDGIVGPQTSGSLSQTTTKTTYDTNTYTGNNSGGSGSTGSGSGSSSTGSSLFDRNVDYTSVLTSAMQSGNTDTEYLQSLLNQRIVKEQDPEFQKWASPDFNASVQNYINEIKAAEEAKQAEQNKKSQSSYEAALEEALANLQSQLDYVSQAQAAIGSSDTSSYEPTKFDQLKEQLAEKALSMNYNDWLGSEQYAALKNRYGLAGQQNMRDILGQISSRTGGLASSYATSAAQQQYNDYMAQLEAAAQDMYSNEQQSALNKASQAYDYADDEYQRYLDEVAQANVDRSYAYELLSDAIANSKYQQEWDATVENNTYNQNLDKAQTLAAAGDFSGYRALGYSEDEITAMQKAYYQSLYESAADNSSNKGSGNVKSTNISSGTDTSNTGAKKDSTVKETASDGTENYTVTNQNGSSWVYIPGHGRFSWQEIANYVEDGTVKEVVNTTDKTITYKWNK